MSKFVWQWSFQVWLVLVGFGISLIPEVETWAYSIAVWIAAFIWLIVTIILWAKSRHKISAVQKASEDTNKIRRLESALHSFKAHLVPWLYEYTHYLTGNSHFRPEGDVWGKFNNDVPLFNDVFERCVRSKDMPPPSVVCFELSNYPVSPQSLLNCLAGRDGGMDFTNRIGDEVKKIQPLLGEVSGEVAKIVILPDHMNRRISELEQWVKEHEPQGVIDNSWENTRIRSNLAVLGAEVRDIVIAIYAEEERLKSIST